MITETCPRCGEAMAVRTNTETGEEFLGCTNYPACRGTRPLPLHLVKLRRGDPMLPGFDEVPTQERKET